MTYDNLVKLIFAQNVTVIPSAMVYVLTFKFGLPLLSPVTQWPHPYSTSMTILRSHHFFSIHWSSLAFTRVQVNSTLPPSHWWNIPLGSNTNAMELWNHVAVVNSEVFQMPQDVCMCVFLDHQTENIT